MKTLDAQRVRAHIFALSGGTKPAGGTGGMVQKLKLIVASVLLVTLWVTPEQSALTRTTQAEEPPKVDVVNFTLPESSWNKLRSLFLPPEHLEANQVSRKGKT